MKERKTILLVDDDESNHVLMKVAFRNAGSDHDLNFVENGESALDFLQQREPYTQALTPALILLDLNLPGKDGFEILNEIRQLPATCEIPVVILTGSNAVADIETCKRFKRCEHVLKPSRFTDMIELVKSLESRYLTL